MLIEGWVDQAPLSGACGLLFNSPFMRCAPARRFYPCSMPDRQVIADGRQSTYIFRSIRSGDEVPSPAKGAGQIDLFLEGQRQAAEMKRTR